MFSCLRHDWITPTSLDKRLPDAAEGSSQGHAEGDAPSQSLEDDASAVAAASSGTGRRLPLYLLGRDRDDRWTFAIDVSGCKQAFLKYVPREGEVPFRLDSTRILLPSSQHDLSL